MITQFLLQVLRNEYLYGNHEVASGCLSRDRGISRRERRRCLG